ncbi:hypothetical protein [Rhodopseudomonas sp. RCAM05734]|uniref:hypothetical protein n=1 Tax=Rhodopseudomonas sp. RCAM05734 TaxID=3457549 RepID=UPI004043D232
MLEDAKAAQQHARTLASNLRDNHALTSGTIVVEDEDAGQTVRSAAGRPVQLNAGRLSGLHSIASWRIACVRRTLRPACGRATAPFGGRTIRPGDADDPSRRQIRVRTHRPGLRQMARRRRRRPLAGGRVVVEPSARRVS